MENISFLVESSSVLAKVAKDLKILLASQHHLPTTQLTTPHKTYATATGVHNMHRKQIMYISKNIKYVSHLSLMLQTHPKNVVALPYSHSTGSQQVDMVSRSRV